MTGQDALSRKEWCMVNCRRLFPYCFCGTAFSDLLENEVEKEFCF